LQASSIGDDVAERAGLLKSEIRSTKSETNSNLKIPNEPLSQSLPLEGEGRVKVAEVSDFEFRYSDFLLPVMLWNLEPW
jgi:hypothetical protein